MIFGKYEIIRRVAVGGMGEIFLARQTSDAIRGFDRLVILKSLLPDLAEDDKAVEQFLDEARVAATLNHPNIVAIYEVGLWEGTYFIAMEYIDGENVGNLIRACLRQKKPLPPALTARVIHDSALALGAAHNAKDSDGQLLNLVHRDVSPQNIMVRMDGVTKVVDFGIAKAANRSTRTATGLIKGRVRYMPSEQLLGKDLDGRSDQFSLGVVMWEMSTAKRLFTNDRYIAERLTNDLIIPPSQCVEDYPPELETILLRMLQADPAARFDSCADVADALAPFLAQNIETTRPAALAQFVEEVVGAQIAERTADLNPSKENFFISLKQPTSPSRPVEIPVPLDEPTVELTTEDNQRESHPEEQPLDTQAPHHDLTREDPVVEPIEPIEPLVIDPPKKPVAWIFLGLLCLAGVGYFALTTWKQQPQPKMPVVQVIGDVNKVVPIVPSALDASIPPDGGAIDAGRKKRVRLCNAKQLTRAFARRRPQIQSCVDKNAEAVTGAPSISIRFRVNRSGKVESAELLPPALAPTPLGKCILNVAQKTRFCRPKETVLFRIPLELRTRR